jgi:hypothetical protein
MKAVLLIATFLMLLGCGSSPQGINGHWDAQMFNTTNPLAYSFSAVLTQGSSAAVNVSNFNFAISPSCFAAQTSETASFTVTGKANGLEIGNFNMAISAAPSGTQNVLSVRGVRNPDGLITGTWTLTGSTGCTANGTFSMSDGLPPV